MCALITIAGGVALLMIFAKGRMSPAIACALLCVTCGKPLWLSTWVSPWPGKCLIALITPVLCIALTNVCPSAATCSGFSEKLRTLITGFFGSLFTSTDGAKLVFIPSGKSVWPICDATLCANALPR